MGTQVQKVKGDGCGEQQGRRGAEGVRVARGGGRERQSGEGNSPSVFAAAGRVLLLSLGEDILEFWGEVRAVWVAAAMFGGGDVANVDNETIAVVFGPKRARSVSPTTRLGTSQQQYAQGLCGWLQRGSNLAGSLSVELPGGHGVRGVGGQGRGGLRRDGVVR